MTFLSFGKFQGFRVSPRKQGKDCSGFLLYNVAPAKESDRPGSGQLAVRRRVMGVEGSRRRNVRSEIDHTAVKVIYLCIYPWFQLSRCVSPK